MKVSAIRSAATGRVLGAVLALAAFASGGVALAADTGAPRIRVKPLVLAGELLSYNSVISPNGKTLYTASPSNGLDAIDLAHPSAAPVAITDAGKPLPDAIALALTANGKTLYVSGQPSGGSAGVYVADVSGDKGHIVGEIADPHALLKTPTGLALSANGKTLYIGDVDVDETDLQLTTGSVAVAELKHPTSGTVVKDYKAPQLGFNVELALNPNGKVLYGSNLFGLAAVMKVSGEHVTKAAPLAEANGLFGLAVTPNGRTLYGDTLSTRVITVGEDSGPSEVDTYALSNNGLTASLQGSTVLGYGFGLLGIAISPNGRTAYSGTAKGSAMNIHVGLATFAIPKATKKTKKKKH